jgi:hypothetical protein
MCIVNLFGDFDAPTMDLRVYTKCILRLTLTTSSVPTRLQEAVPEHCKPDDSQ